MMFGIDDAYMIAGIVSVAGNILGAFTSQKVEPPQSPQDAFYEEMTARFRKVGEMRKANAQVASMLSGQPIERFQHGGGMSAGEFLQNAGVQQGTVGQYASGATSAAPVLTDVVRAAPRYSGTTPTNIRQGAYNKATGEYDLTAEFSQYDTTPTGERKQSVNTMPLNDWLSSEDGKAWYSAPGNKEKTTLYRKYLQGTWGR